ncbi:hypothetical protein NX868_29390 [Burkholderia thailandensis]|uniref:Uncharacterized protein n=1 Tax=Burkholderia thailandensis TaxID=57975 RepID=A0AAW9CTX1_BURTH|nr:hypothetical protein [Burkholderia thailandensis]AHI68123.1 hypothetical protein BTL_3858 [Burkholderia thailandensis H0587]AOJ53665.1 hypothetical protein AQ475_22850 [Burkholderia thailandensis]AVR28200.1 hypothetical protein A8H32_25055 [Burkholderia thailandensis]MCS3395298.1 hypothetical protein [Burkholderia thailandensis]MCS6427925.1 hypothetical protein [Burkholderia thailandensis]
MTDDITTPAPSSAARPLPSFGPLRWIVRHWRGGYSLAVSFWLNPVPVSVLRTVCSEVLMTRVFELLDHGQGPGDNDAIASAIAAVPAVVLADAALSLLNVWWIVGVWRAAERHIALTGRRFWARAAQLAVALVAAHIVYKLAIIPHSIESLQLFIVHPMSIFTDPAGALKSWLF